MKHIYAKVRIDGELWDEYMMVKTKKQADKIADKLRTKGQKARVRKKKLKGFPVYYEVARRK